MEHAHDHSHIQQLDADTANNKAFITGIVLNVLFVITEVVAGLINDSMALLTDAGHNISDVASLLLSLLAFRLAKKKSTAKYTYGYKKTTVLAALTNAVILLIAIGILGYESISRLIHPKEIKGDVIAWVAGLGIVINGVSAFLFYKNREKDLNVKSAYLHLLADTLVSVGVVAGGLLIAFTDWYWLDPAIGLVVMVVILIGTWSLLKNSFQMAVDAVPAGIDLANIKNVIRKVNNVSDVRHVHVWPISTTENALTAHVIVESSLSAETKEKVVKEVKHELEHHNIQHSTIELEFKHAGGQEQLFLKVLIT